MGGLIHRVAAAKIVADMWGLCRGDVLRGAIQAINELPAVDAVPVVDGRWIETTIPANTTGHGGVGQDKKKGWLCSNCKCAFDAKLLWCDSFCPNCGAKMDEEG